ncbi:MAG TPA: hypothetical protein H9911_01250 [Candidatus Mediterraneibacter tabaqchaliae]|uniref:Uncharacterized protein n=1 Tax=Candidatus Mediterraneibacter tabaqchaliae TaxID=2838689 RepID=A0A9D2R5H4_9FIRM|nr:hypothetical protein [Candidatus Mediterraneibacter tabaqchaliae]
MGVSNDNTIMYKNDSSIIELSESQLDRTSGATTEFPPHSRESTAPELFSEPEPQEDAPDTDKDADVKINQSNYLRYLSDLRKADSELALAKAESAELVRLMDSYKEHYTEYEKLIHTLVLGNNTAVNQQLDTIKALARKLKKTSSSLDARIDKEIQRLTLALAQSIQGSVKDSCDKELAKVSEATQVLSDYSAKVKQQYRRFERLEGFKFALFIISSISSPIVLVLFVLNMLQII